MKSDLQDSIITKALNRLYAVLSECEECIDDILEYIEIKVYKNKGYFYHNCIHF